MKQIELANGRGFALVDDEDFEWLNGYKWHITGDGYAARTGKGLGKGKLVVAMHREILGLSIGDGKEVDHIDSNKLDNCRRNLRVCTREGNCYNKAKQNPKGSSSRYKGVSWNIRRQKWQAQISCGGVNYWLGYFDDEAEAAIAYDHKARKLFGEFAGLNFPDINVP